MTKDQPSNCWWLDNYSTLRRSPCLQSTLAGLNEKTKAMLKEIKEDADTFAQRTEIYFKKRPELISMVEDFYRTQRSLPERYDQVKSDTGIRFLTTGVSPFSYGKYQSDNLMGFTNRSYDSYSENCDVEESVEFEIDDSELELATKFTKEDNQVIELREEIERLREENRAYKDQLNRKDDEIVILKEEIEILREGNKAYKDQLELKDALCSVVTILKEEIERFREENRGQRDQLKEKDEEKMEVIKHLSLAIDMLKQENVKMRNYIAQDYYEKWKNPFDFNNLMGTLSGKLFIRMVEDFYRTQRSFVECYDQVKFDTGIRLLTTGVSPFPYGKYQSDNLMGFTDRSYDSYSENCDVEESAEFEIDDSELESATKFTKEDNQVIGLREEIERLREENRAYKDQLNQKDAMSDEIVILKEEIEILREGNKAYKDQLELKDALCSEVTILREEIERVREENRRQRDQLKEKDEEKMEVIKHLSLAIDMLKQENVKMRN